MKYTLTGLLALLAFTTTQAQEEMSKAYYKDNHFAKIDADGDGFVTKEEVMAMHRKRIDSMFDGADENGDGKLSQAEMRASFKEMMNKMRNRIRQHREKMDDQ